jgi:hypothetical protein
MPKKDGESVEIKKDVTTKIETTTKGLQQFYKKHLTELPSQQAIVICNYVTAVGNEIKLSDKYRSSIIYTLVDLSKRIGKTKRFRDFTRVDVLKYLNHFKKDDNIDQSHKWIGTYNLNLIHLIKFFRWLYSPDLEPVKRPKPKVVQNLSKFKRREISGYKPSDMWDAEDNLLFLKYCPSPRDRCYHSMEVDIAARPHELLNLKIKDVEFV